MLGSSNILVFAILVQFNLSIKYITISQCEDQGNELSSKLLSE